MASVEETQPLTHESPRSSHKDPEELETIHYPEPTAAARLIIEFIGTFFLVLTVYLTVAQSIHNPKFKDAGLAIGTVLGVMIYMGGHISGAHYNPAVTLGVMLTGRSEKTRLNWGMAGAYIAVQVLGGIVAALIGYGVSGVAWSPAPGAKFNTGMAFGMETLFTFALVSIVLNVATAQSTESNHYYGYAIGLIVFVGATSVGGISGAVFNPAVGSGIILVDCFFGGSAANLWLYWLGPCFGGALAALVFYMTNPNEFSKYA